MRESKNKSQLTLAICQVKYRLLQLNITKLAHFGCQKVRVLYQKVHEIG
jgi:hypothetical protein